MTAERQARRAARNANRGAARLAAVQALYQMDVAGTPLAEVVGEFDFYRLGDQSGDGSSLPDGDAGFFREIVTGVVERQRELDPAIHACLSPGWPLQRIDATLRAILRAGAFELTGKSDIPARVVVSQYVEIARSFFDADVTGMVNAVLDAVARRYRAAEFPAEMPKAGGDVTTR